MSIYQDIAFVDREIIKHLESVKELRLRKRVLQSQRIADETGIKLGDKYVLKGKETEAAYFVFALEYDGYNDIVKVRKVMEKTARFGYSHHYTVQALKNGFLKVEAALEDFKYVECAQSGNLTSNIS